MLKKHLTIFIGIGLLLAFALTGCTDANEDFIQGSWIFTDMHFKEVGGVYNNQIDNVTEWDFDRGSFIFTSCCFNDDYHISGLYRILDSQENVLDLELYNVKGTLRSRNDRFPIRIVIDFEEGTAAIMGGGPFTRIEP